MCKQIDIDSVSKTYGSEEDMLHVIDEIDIDVDANELVVIVGPSGCGKSTLLKMIDGLVTPTSGEVRIGGETVTGSRSEVAMVFQDFNLLPWRTVRENVEFGLEVQGVDDEAQREQALEWIEKVGLDGFEDSYPHELSGGMQQRVGLARALAIDPEVLLMDEPFGALDAQTKDQMQTELLRLLANENKTVVFITHDIREAILIADRVLVMSTKPATILADLDIDSERPRWNRRTEIETSEPFEEYETRIRKELGLMPTDAAAGETGATAETEPTQQSAE
ncbi:ABC transporter ATP-binding protein [Natrinema salifodinae]|uniref:Molybdate/tungstate import ATP-binding protein WtpC n=1 Tax=Natrinema salifodinae TaxID=1202768 RepID=A0A1I0LYZ6_9EURY|nr:ABC transporter ATP-binding protein [Natrinema salifodinae]SEV80146.1 NitT/TauT family transport system ATP-binding protein [Natrinema salifodinae]